MTKVRQGPGPFTVLPVGRVVLVKHDDKSRWRVIEEIAEVGDIYFRDWHVCLTCKGGEPPPSYSVCPRCKGSLAERHSYGEYYHHPPRPIVPKCDKCSGYPEDVRYCGCEVSKEHLAWRKAMEEYKPSLEYRKLFKENKK